jgi:hypothetical protein
MRIIMKCDEYWNGCPGLWAESCQGFKRSVQAGHIISGIAFQADGTAQRKFWI